MKVRGIQTSRKSKNDLIALCKACELIPLDINPDLTESEESSKATYLKKLQEFDVADPLSITAKFKEVNDVGEIPPIGLYNIFNYLLYSRADYDQRKLQAYKSAEDYRLCVDGHVLQVLTYDNGDSDIVSILSHVKPTQKDLTYLKKNFYTLWILVKKQDGIIKLAYCECKGG